MAESTVTGLHVTATIMRQAKVRRTGDRIEIIELTSMPSPRPATGNGSTASPDPGAAHAMNSTITIASLPAADVMTRCWSMPPADESRFQQMVRHRLDADLPVPIDQLVWDCRRGGDGVTGEGASSVLAQAARSERVARQMGMLAAAGFNVHTLTTESEGLAALCQHGLGIRTGRDPHVLVLAGSEAWMMLVLLEGMVKSLRRITLAGSLVTACQECRQFLDGDEALRPLRRVLWCGDASTDGARELLSERLGVPVEPLSIPDTLLAPGGARLGADQVAEYGPAIGLALAGLLQRDRVLRLGGRTAESLSPGRDRIEKLLLHPWRWTIAAACLALLAGGVYLSALSWETNRMSKALAARAASVDDEDAELPDKVRALDRIDRYRVNVEETVARVCELIPDSMIIASIRVSREHGLELKCTKGDSKACFELAGKLREMDRFDSVRAVPNITGEGWSITADITDIKSLQAAGGRTGGWR